MNKRRIVGVQVKLSPWSISILQQEGYGRLSNKNVMPVHLRQFIVRVHSGREFCQELHGVPSVQVNIIGCPGTSWIH
jgi:hypothetical protein